MEFFRQLVFIIIYCFALLYIFWWVAGHDGNFFVYNYMSQKDVDAEVVKAKIPSAFKLAEDKKLPDDIEDPAAYRFVLRFFFEDYHGYKIFFENFELVLIDEFLFDFSIEDAKQKAEHDKMMKEAEERKQDVRRIIAQLRRQFKKLLEKNHELPPHLRLGVIVSTFQHMVLLISVITIEWC